MFEGTFQEIIVTIVACEISSLPMVLYRNNIEKLFIPEGQTRIYIDDFKNFLLLIFGYLAVVSISLAVMYLTGKLLRKINYRTKLFNVLGIIGFVFYFLIDLLAILGSISKSFDFKFGNYIGHYVFWIFWWIVFFVLMYMINDYFTKKRLRREIEVLNEEKARQFEYYNLVKIHNEEVRKIRHDIKGHLSAIFTLVEEKEYDRAKEYVFTLNENFEKVRRVNITGNVNADTVICDMAEKCSSQNIKFTPKGFLSEKTGIDDVSLTCIFTNILNNAYEACLRMAENEKKFINLDVRISGDCIVIKCENSKSTNEKINTKSIKTIKKESGHGYGIKIINEIVKEKDGIIEIEDKAEIFEIKILLSGAGGQEINIKKG